MCWIVTLDVLKWNSCENAVEVVPLNSNIRCIEIQQLEALASDSESWIVTLDVLKYEDCNIIEHSFDVE